jgi:FAD:protein FMN transferase
MKQYICPVRFLIILLVFFYGQKSFKQYSISGFAQGTTYHVIYYANDSLITRAEIDATFNSLDSSLSLYKPYSLINAFNNSKSGLVIDAHLKNVVEKSLQVYTSTNGAFDITVWPLVNAWGFGVKKIDAPPDKNKIDSIMPCIGSNKIKLQENLLTKQLPCVNIDVNGIAQGYSADVIAELLESKGIANYMVEIGGEIRVKGRKQPGNEKMKIGIESPSDDAFSPAPVRIILSIDSGAVTTSGSYLKFYESNGKRITHLIDPRTGNSIQNELISVTVFAKDAITADAYDNALMVMGLQQALHFAPTKQLEAYFIYRTKQGTLADTATAGFYKLVTSGF